MFNRSLSTFINMWKRPTMLNAVPPQITLTTNPSIKKIRKKYPDIKLVGNMFDQTSKNKKGGYKKTKKKRKTKGKRKTRRK